jgi:hypothetical protein
MPKLILRGAFIRFVDLRYDDKSKQKYVKLNFTAAFSEPVREALEWGKPPVGFDSAKLDGDLTAIHFVLTPDGKELRQHELQLDSTGISNFEFARVNVGEDNFEQQLRFQIVTSAVGAAGRVEAYIEAIGKGTAQLRVNYEQQSEMPLEDKQEPLISREQARDTSEETDNIEETSNPDAAAPLAPLASAVAMGEGTHQKRKPRENKSTVN